MNAFFIPLNQFTILLATALLSAALVVGLYVCFRGLKRLASTERQPDAPATAADDSPSTPQPVPQPQNPPQPTNPKIIRLSSNVPAPSSAQEMSQQGKIAAALTRAGLTEPAARPEHPDHHTD
ncbi:MAG TPA: hypothetical protein VKR59_06175 [Terriglobales bacterium]|nr:hypothetical protein [Terriglobales bacterium]